jgi:hypothetical protein
LGHLLQNFLLRALRKQPIARGLMIHDVGCPAQSRRLDAPGYATDGNGSAAPEIGQNPQSPNGRQVLDI